MTTFWQENMSLLSLERRSVKAYQSLQQTADAQEELDIQLFETDQGDYTIQFHQVFLHDIKGAQVEAKRICDNAEHFHPGTRSNHLLLGIGLGYELDEIFRRSEGKIFIYEPHLDLLKFVFENVGLTDYLASHRVYLATSVPDLIHQLRNRYIVGEHLDVLTTNGYATILSKDISILMSDLVGLVEDQRININMGMNYHFDWLQHFFKNIPHFINCASFDDCLDEFQTQTNNKPAVVISSGPSLDKAIDDLKKYRHCCTLIAVGGALRPLLAAGIEPDFAVFLDFSGPKEQLTNLPRSTENIRFLFSPFVDTYCFCIPAKSRYLVSLTNYPSYSDWLDSTFNEERHRVASGGTVSLLAFEIALALGCNPLILAGQDLALTGGQYYAGGISAAFIENKAVLETSETMVAREVPLREIQGQDGTLLQTTEDYFAYRKDFSALAHRLKQDYPDLKLFNASAGGALIPGFEHEPLSNILEAIPDKKNINLSTFSPSNTINTQQQSQQLYKEVHSLKQNLAKIVILAGAVLKNLQVLVESERPSTQDEYQYKLARQDFTAALNDMPFVEYCLRLEIWKLQENFCFAPKTPAEIRHNWQADAQYFQNSVTLIQEKLLPWVEACLTQFPETIALSLTTQE